MTLDRYMDYVIAALVTIVLVIAATVAIGIVVVIFSGLASSQ